MNPYSPDLLVDQVIGSAYQIVKYVAANMEMLIELSDAIPVLEGYLDEINLVLANMTNINTVATNITSVNTVSSNIGAVNTINTNITALLTIYTNLAAILAVPGAIAAQDWKNSVVVATTANITLSGTQTIDGVAVVAGNRVLVKNQTTASQNGIYVVAAGAWARASDALAPNVSTNNVVLVEQGTVGAGKIFRLSTTGTITVGTTAQTWVEFVSGENNTTTNEGTGVGLAMPKDGVNLPFKTLVAGVNVTLTDNGDEIEIAASGGGGGVGSGEANTTSNVGTGVGLAKAKSGVDLPFKTLKAGTGITLTNSTDEVEISASGGAASTSVMVPIAMATTYLQLPSSLGQTGDGSTWASYDRVNMSATGPASYDPDGIVDNVNQVFIVPAGATHFSVDYMINVRFASDTVDLLVEISMDHKPMPWGSPGGLVVDHVDVMTSSNNSFAYKTMTGSSAKIPCTPGNGISVSLYWESAASAATSGVIGLLDSAITITFYTAP